MSRDDTAWHEAGHLAAGVIHQAEIGTAGATIRGGHWHDGTAHVYIPIDGNAIQDAWWRAVNGEQVDPTLRDAVERQAYVLLAGGLTEAVAEQRGIIGIRPPVDIAAPEHRARRVAALISGEPKPRGDSGELDALLRSICTDSEEQDAYRRVLELRAELMVRRHPRFWPLVEGFAAALLERETISGEEIAAIAAESQ